MLVLLAALVLLAQLAALVLLDAELTAGVEVHAVEARAIEEPPHADFFGARRACRGRAAEGCPGGRAARVLLAAELAAHV